jgi:Ca2+-binding EF-hand superfamily protein
MLTTETERQIKSAFDTLDSNRDGLLTREDWTQLERFLADRT